MGKPDKPAAPDYAGAAEAQGQANLEAHKQNNPNVVSPYGTQSYYSSTNDPAAYQQQLEDSLAAAQKAIPQWQGGDQSWRVQFNQGENGSERAAQWFTNEQQKQQGIVDTSQKALDDFRRTGLVPQDSTRPTMIQQFSPEQQALYDQNNATQLQLGKVAGQGATALEGVVGTPVDFSGAPQTGNYDATRKSVIDAYMSRANEDYWKQTDQSNSDLIARGIPVGSTAYGNERQMIERSRNDARQQAEIQGGNAASQAYGMDADRRRQAITEMLAQRQTPINEISALMSGSQVSNPFSTPGYSADMQAAPVYNAENQAAQYGTDVYNAQAAQAGNTQSGLIGLGGTALMGGAML